MKRIITTLLLFGVVNAILVGGQWLSSLPDTLRISAIEKEITAIQEEVTRLEIELKLLAETMKKQKAEMSQLETEIKTIESKYPGGSLPPRIYEDYSAKVDRHNRLAKEYNNLLTKYQTLYKDYDAKLRRQTSLVEEGKSLAQKRSRIWVLVPR